MCLGNPFAWWLGAGFFGFGSEPLVLVDGLFGDHLELNRSLVDSINLKNG